jgi:hypothetical protein
MKFQIRLRFRKNQIHMKNKLHSIFVALALVAGAHQSGAQGTAFTYQGQLQNNGSPASGAYNLTFSLFSTSTSGSPIAGPVTNNGVIVSNGLFMVQIDFGSGAFIGQTNWLEISVETNTGASSFISLTPRQPLTATPYAIYSESAGGVPGLVVQPNSDGSPNLIGGSPVNFVSPGVAGATIGGGGTTNYNISGFGAAAYTNSVTASFGTVSGGAGNIAGLQATVGGGANNTASGLDATVGGGWANQASGNFATVPGGENNFADGQYATVPGGGNNLANGQYTFAAGYNAQAINDGAFVWADPEGTTFASTTTNQFNVRANGGVRFVTGGAGMTLDGQPVLVSGGGSGLTIQQNSSGAPNVIGGSPVNFVSSGTVGATIGGGGATNANGNPYTNSVTDDFGTVGGGNGNTAGNESTVGGGQDNSASGTAFGYSTVGGGYDNSASGDFSTIGGGSGNIAAGTGATVGGGGYDGTFNGNIAIGNASAVGGGQGNSAAGPYATVPGGATNKATGPYSFAAGQQAQALTQGAFVWADSQNAAFASTANDQFLIRARGGVGININNPNGASLSVQGGQTGSGILQPFNNPVVLFQNTNTGPFNAPALRVVNAGGTNVYGALCVSCQVVPGSNNGLIASFGNADSFVVLITNDGTIYSKGVAVTSDRNAKRNFTAIDPKAVLAKVASMPVTTWNYKDDSAGTKHIGPVAQDFHAAFGLNGADDTHISIVDEGGVALAAVQGLNQELGEQSMQLQRKDREIQNLQRENQDLARKLEELKQMVEAIAARK